MQKRFLRESNLDLNKTIEIHVIQDDSAVNPDCNVDEIRRQFSNDRKSQNEISHMAYRKLCDNSKKKNHFSKCSNLKKVYRVQ